MRTRKAPPGQEQPPACLLHSRRWPVRMGSSITRWARRNTGCVIQNRPTLNIIGIVRASGRLQAHNCGAPASRSDFADELIRLSLGGAQYGAVGGAAGLTHGGRLSARLRGERVVWIGCAEGHAQCFFTYSTLLAIVTQKNSAGIFVPAEFILTMQLQFHLSAATPASETTSSCEPVPPLTPMAPINLPPTTSGLPPREAITSSSVGR